MHFKDGIIWAGVQELWYSQDTGKTWHKSALLNNACEDINFLDKAIGLVGSTDDIFHTEDAGVTWSGFGLNRSSFLQVSFNHSANTIHAFEFAGDNLWTSTNRGVSWKSKYFGGYGMNFAIAKDQTLYAFSSDKWVDQGHVNSTVDLGSNWSTNGEFVDADSYTMDIDSCSPGMLYLIHEGLDYTDGLSEIFLSSDGGNTWQLSLSQLVPYLSGSASISSNVIYVGSLFNGVLRSTDYGQSWKSIGGPNIPYDSRTICAVDDNIVFAIDGGGSIWVTFNSGGDSVIASKPFSSSPRQVFQTDTISCDSLNRLISFIRSGCRSQSLSVLSWSIIGDDSSSYRVSNLSFDSMQVTLYGTKPGKQTAILVLNLIDGSTDTVALEGFVKYIPDSISLLTSDIQTDTLGATALVPIMLNGLERAENIDIVLHYDGSVEYLGSFSPSGVQLDIPGEQWAGRSELSVTGATSGAVLGYAKFNVFNDSNAAAHATFDSVNVLTETSTCEYSLPAPATSTITTLSGCAIPILSQLIHLGVEPVLSIVPNPANGNVWISSNTDLGDVTIEIYDMLGIEQSEVLGQISENNPMELLLPMRSGVYNILVRSIVGTRSLRVVREN